MTAQSGRKPLLRHTMSKNFSAPRSAPKPDSVTTMSANFRAYLVAMMELFPWAMLANGKPCMNTGSPSRVCTRLGWMAFFSSMAMAPTQSSWAALTGLWS